MAFVAVVDVSSSAHSATLSIRAFLLGGRGGGRGGGGGGRGNVISYLCSSKDWSRLHRWRWQKSGCRAPSSSRFVIIFQQAFDRCPYSQSFAGVFIARSKDDDMLLTKNMVVGESVYGEKRINVDVRTLFNAGVKRRRGHSFRAKISRKSNTVSGIRFDRN